MKPRMLHRIALALVLSSVSEMSQADTLWRADNQNNLRSMVRVHCGADGGFCPTGVKGNASTLATPSDFTDPSSWCNSPDGGVDDCRFALVDAPAPYPGPPYRALRVRVEQGDNGMGLDGGLPWGEHDRNELARTAGAIGSEIQEDQLRVYAFKVFFPADFPMPPPGGSAVPAFVNFFQFHSDESVDTCSDGVPLSVQLKRHSSGDWQLRVLAHPDPGETPDPNKIREAEVIGVDGRQFQRGRWYDIWLRVLWSAEREAGQPKGRIEAWVDGVKIVDGKNAPTLVKCNSTGSTVASYLKYGQYRAKTMVEPSTLYHFGLKIGTELEDAKCEYLMPVQGIARGESLHSCNGRFLLSMQTDGNLVLYEATSGEQWTSIWATHTTSGAWAVMQSDGNFVLYNTANQAIWSSNTGGRPNGDSYLSLQDDGNLVVYSRAIAPLWSTNTGGR